MYVLTLIMRFLTRIALLLSTIIVLNGCDAQTLNDINNALNNYNNSSYGYQPQQPTYVKPSFPRTQRCTVFRNPLNPNLSTVTCR